MFSTAHNNDLINNPSPRCPCMLVLDTSGSMSGAPIAELNQGLQDFVDSVRDDDVALYSVELGIITAGGSVSEVLPLTGMSELNHVPRLEATGMTPLGSAVGLALQRLEERKAEYQRNGVAYYQPWMVIISDGSPTDSWQSHAAKARDLSLNRKLVSLPIGVAGADLSTLGQFSSKPAVALSGLNFRAFFEWLSASMSRVSASNSTTAGVALPPIQSADNGGWAMI